MDAGAATRYQRIHDLPSPGDRFGELTVVEFRREKRGACLTDMVLVQCSCGKDPHLVYLSNLHQGKSTRCNVCAKQKSGAYRKWFFKYAESCPDDEHRRRLLNRLAACRSRCHNPRDKNYPNYGGRGIHVYAVWLKDKHKFLEHVVGLDGWDQPHLELDRIDNERGYEPGNLRFCTRRENAGNKRFAGKMQLRIRELEDRVRHLELWNAELLYPDV